MIAVDQSEQQATNSNLVALLTKIDALNTRIDALNTKVDALVSAQAQTNLLLSAPLTVSIG